jgi:DNA-directed RNA polymerase subunit RPC12/RpoP
MPETRVWCVKCDKNMKYEGIAFDHPADGDLYICPKCDYRIIIFQGETNT